jgi:vitellogenic carboxypeptidase-like protein
LTYNKMRLPSLLALAAAISGCSAQSGDKTRSEHSVRSGNLPFSSTSDAQKVGDSHAGHIVVRKTPEYEAGT